MDRVERKKGLVSGLSAYHKALDVPRLYSLPQHKESKDWLANVAAILKNLDESDFQHFMKLKQSLYKHLLRTTRKPVAEEIDNFIRQKVAEYKLYDFESQEEIFTRTRSLPKSNNPYVAKGIIVGFGKKQDKFNYKKLLKLLNELNSNYAKQRQYSSAMLIRAIIDHIPPLLGFTLFKEVVNHYPWLKTDKQYMKGLLDFKKDADDTLHRPISEDEDFFEISNLPSSNRFNRLLQECLKGGGDKEFAKAKILRSRLEKEETSKIEVSLVDDRSGSWQNYSIGSYVGYSFKFVLNIDNFRSSRLDYVSVFLKASSKDGSWTAKHFIFETEKSDPGRPYEVGAGKENLVTVVISDQEFSHSTHEHRFKPSVDMETLTLCVIAKSGKRFEFPIKEDTLK